MNKYDKWSTPIMVLAMAIWFVALIFRLGTVERRIEAIENVQVEIVETLTLAVDTKEAFGGARIGVLEKRVDICEYRLDTSVQVDESMIVITEMLTSSLTKVMDDLGYSHE